MVKSRTVLAITLVFAFLTSFSFPFSGEARTVKKSTSRSHKAKSASHKRKGKSKKGSRSKHRSHKRSSKKSRARHVSQELGILIQSSTGEVIENKSSDKSFNPASAIKLLTAYSALKTLGPDHKFTTELSIDGQVDEENGVLKGNVYIAGNDPEFGKSDSFQLLEALKSRGIKRVDGKLMVSDTFSLYCSNNAVSSGKGLTKIFRFGRSDGSVVVDGPVEIGGAPETAQSLVKHESEELQKTLKHMLSRSINSAAERIGYVIGGVPKLRKIAVDDIGIPEDSIRISTASGLGQNRITPKHMMMVLRSLEGELGKHDLGFQNILPVAGIDNGTLEKRFTKEEERGSVVAKTGTLSHTDGGVSALVGVMRSQKEDLYFVIFGWHGGVSSMRKNQDVLIRQLQDQRGGPKPFEYNI